MVKRLALFLMLLGCAAHALGYGSQLVTDVALRPGNVLQGTLVDGNGRAKEGAEVVITDLRAQEVVWRDVSHADGRFDAHLPRGGVYAVSVDQGKAVIRAWTDGTAPPSANAAILLVCAPDRARGQKTPPLNDGVRTIAAVTACVGLAYMVYILVDKKSSS